MCGDYNLVILKVLMNKNAFQWDVYCPLVDHIPAWAGGMYPSMHWAGGVSQQTLGRGCLPRGVSAQGVSACGCLSRGCLPGGSAQRGVCLGDVSPRGVCPGGCLPREGVCLGGLPRGCGRHPPPGPKADTPTMDRQTPVKT